MFTGTHELQRVSADLPRFEQHRRYSCHQHEQEWSQVYDCGRHRQRQHHVQAQPQCREGEEGGMSKISKNKVKYIKCGSLKVGMMKWIKARSNAKCENVERQNCDIQYHV